jgi:hypothetical protein
VHRLSRGRGSQLLRAAMMAMGWLLLAQALAGTPTSLAVPAPADHLSALPPPLVPDESKDPQRVWVALEDAKELVKVDLRTRRVVRRLAVSGRPHNITVGRTGLVAATLWSADRVALQRGSWRRGVSIPGAPHDVKIGNRRIVIANQGAARVNLRSLKGKRRGRISLPANPHDLALSLSGRSAWVTLERSDDIAIVGLAKKRVRRYLSTGRSPHDILFSPNGQVWVTDWNGAVHVFSRGGKLIKSRSLGKESHHLAFTPDGRQAWITDHGAHRVFVLSTRTHRIVKRFKIRGSPHHVAITPDGKKAAVADHDRGLVVVYRVATLKRVGRIAVGAGPHGVWAVP